MTHGQILEVVDKGHVEIAMEERIGDVELSCGPLTRSNDTEDSADGCWFHDQSEGLPEIDAGALGEPPDDPTCFVALEGAVGVEFVLEHPFPRDDLGVEWTINQSPCTVGLESSEFMFHGGMPVWFMECHTDGGWHG